jgi:hypothetical protein
MVADEYEIDVRPEVMLMEQVLGPLAVGELRIPEFQRPFVWRPEQILDLFDSIERGYPIGSLLFWETAEHLPSLDQVGGLLVPEPPPGRTVSYVLDGHQRLSALYGTLRRPADAPRSSTQSDWMWWTYRVLGATTEEGPSRYRHWRSAEPPPPNYLPLRSVLRTRDFLAYARELSERAAPGMDVDQLTAEAELVAQRFRQYKISVVRLVGGTLSEAVEVFSRVNSTGQNMRPAQMVSALTYRKRGQQTLANRLDAMVEQIADTGFGEVSSDALFRAVLAVTGEDNVQEARWDVLARRVVDDLQQAVDNTEEASARAVVYLRDTVNVPLARLIPYDAQLMLLTTFFYHCPAPKPAQLEELTRWFWATSWSGSFAGANSTDIKRAIQRMRRFARGHGTVTPKDSRPRPFPNRFDLRSARVRAFIIWELQEFPERLDADAQTVSAVDILARGATAAYRHVVNEPGVSAISSPANRLIMPTRPRTSVRTALLNLPASIREPVLTSHGIPEEALARLADGDGVGFIETRQRFLADRERQFMAGYGLATTSEVGEADIDTE